MIEAELASGACATSRPLWSDIFQRSLETLAFIDPHLLLHLLLPPLVFESAFAIDWHIFDQLKWVTLLLAVPGTRAISPTNRTHLHLSPATTSAPGVVASTFILGSVVNGMLLRSHDGSAVDCAYECSAASGYDGAAAVWMENAGYVLGVILSATDPVAVVALLKELGVKAGRKRGCVRVEGVPPRVRGARGDGARRRAYRPARRRRPLRVRRG